MIASSFIVGVEGLCEGKGGGGGGGGGGNIRGKRGG